MLCLIKYSHSATIKSFLFWITVSTSMSKLFESVQKQSYVYGAIHISHDYTPSPYDENYEMPLFDIKHVLMKPSTFLSLPSRINGVLWGGRGKNCKDQEPRFSTQKLMKRGFSSWDMLYLPMSSKDWHYIALTNFHFQ